MQRLIFRVVLASLAFAIAPDSADAELARGPESFSQAAQFDFYDSSNVSRLVGGELIAVYRTERPLSFDAALMVQRLDSDGNFLGSAFTVVDDFAAMVPDVAATSDGGFVLVWTDNDPYREVVARRYDGDGTALGAEFTVNDYTTVSPIRGSSVAALENGGFVVVWGDETLDNDIIGRLYDGAGMPASAAFHVTTDPTSFQYHPVVESMPDGGFLVVWEDTRPLPGDTFPGYLGPEIFGRRFDAAGSPIGTEFQANTFTPNNQSDISVAVADDGSFAVAWNSDHPPFPSNPEVVARVYDSSGNPTTGADFVVNTYTSDRQDQPAVAALPGGGFIVAWRDEAQEGNDPQIINDHNDGIYAHRLGADGSKVGTPFHVNGHAAGHQQHPLLVADAEGLTAVWRDDNRRGEVRFGARRLCGDGEADADGDGSGDRCDICTAAPGEQTFASAIASLESVISDLEWSDDRLKLRGKLDLPTGSLFANLQPLSIPVRLQLFASDGRDIVDETLPAIAYDRTTKSGWKGGTSSWKYRDPSGALLGGTSLITIRARPDGRTIRVTVRARQAQLLVNSTDQPLRLAMSLGSASAGECGEIDFAPESCSVSSANDALSCRQ